MNSRLRYIGYSDGCIEVMDKYDNISKLKVGVTAELVLCNITYVGTIRSIGPTSFVFEDSTGASEIKYDHVDGLCEIADEKLNQKIMANYLASKCM